MNLILNHPYFSVLILLCCLNFLMISLWNKNIFKQLHPIYQAEQKIHAGSISPFGGLCIITSIFVGSLFNLLPSSGLFLHILLCLIPVIIITILEDLFNNIQPRARLGAMFVSSALLISLNNFPLPVIEWPILANFFSSYPLIFSALLITSLIALSNGFNLIDGANGLFYFSILSILACLIALSLAVGNETFTLIWTALTAVYFTQTLFNFPLGKIFLGDLGAYASGIILGFLIIIFFGSNVELLTWQLVLILFYPIFEIIFSMLRRKISNKRLTHADRLHLHQIVFDLLRLNISNIKIANNLTTIVLFPIWSLPLFLMFFYDKSLLNFNEVMLGLLIQILTYCVYYFVSIYLKKIFEKKYAR